MNKKIIIDNQSDISLLQAFLLVERIISSGKNDPIGKGSIYADRGLGVMVWSKENKMSQSFTIMPDSLSA